MATNLDVRFQSAIADHLPAALVNPTHSLETSHAVSSRLDDLRGPSRFAVAATGRQGVDGARLPRLGAAPDFTGNQRWFNTPGGQPLSLTSAARQGRARRLLDLHVHQLPAHAALPRGVGRALSPRRPGHRRRALARVPLRARRRQRRAPPSSARGSAIPVAQDNKLATWNAWGNQYWPADYLIDARGQVRDAHFGEGDYDQHRDGHPGAAEGGRPPQPGRDGRRRRAPCTRRAWRRPRPTSAWRAPSASTRRRCRARTPTRTPPKLATSHFALSGTWDEERRRRDGPRRRRDPRRDRRQGRLSRPQPARGRGAATSRCCSTAGRSPAIAAGADVHGGVVRVDRQRLYHLVSAPAGEHHVLTLRVAPGVQAYAFTFG